MRKTALDLAAAEQEPAAKLNLLREYVQACFLRSLHEAGAFRNLSFVGGTALRFLYRLHRFSEDLDFSLESPSGYDPVRWLEKTKRDFSRLGFDAEISWNNRSVIHTAWLRVPGLLAEAGLSSQPEQKLSIKLEIDSNPPAGAVLETRVLNRHLIFALRHHDIGSLFAGKIRALLTRPFQKGRDWYDLLWYLGQIPPIEPNPVLLENALAQVSQVNHYDPEKRWKSSIANLLLGLDMEKLQADVRPFLENPGEADLLTREAFHRLLDPAPF